MNMARNVKLLSVFLQLLFILDPTKASGLSIKLIHRHNVKSPFYPGNITRNQRIHLHLLSASAYISRLSAATSSNHTFSSKLIRPEIHNQYLLYMVEAGIGEFAPPHPPHYKYFLHLDTSSDLTWTQCQDCKKWGPRSCFLQKAPLYPAGGSDMYRPLPCNRHPLCSPSQCINATCSYMLLYGDGATTLGYLASESFTFNSDNKYNRETIRDFVFECGIKNQDFPESSRNNLVAGNFGLGEGKFSILKQKRALTGGRFSYCLLPWDVSHKSTTFLTFGDDIPDMKGLKMTPLSTGPGSASYYVVLKGISVGNRRVDIPESMLARRGRDYGGCIVDSGSTITILPPPVYEKLKSTLIKNHFSKFKPAGNRGILSLCYFFPWKTGVKDLPNITFHLQDADLVFTPQVGFIVSRTSFFKGYFCLAMKSGDINGLTIVGASQQANTRFVFDTMKKKLYFAPEVCAVRGWMLPA